MDIKSKLKMVAISLITIAVALSLFLIYMAKEIDQALRRGEGARHIADAASDLNLIAYDYLLNPGERSLKQWQLKCASFSNLISGSIDNKEEELYIWKRINRNFGTIKTLFSQIVAEHEPGGRFHKGQRILERDGIDKIASQFMAKTQMIMADSSLLMQKRDEQMAAVKRHVFIPAVVACLLMIMIVTLTSLHLSRTITSSLRKLDCIEIIANEDLNHTVSIPNQDETSRFKSTFTRWPTG